MSHLTIHSSEACILAILFLIIQIATTLCLVIALSTLHILRHHKNPMSSTTQSHWFQDA